MVDLFDHTMEYVFAVEGGYVNDPDDPGGETNYGISKRYHKDVDIKNLTKEDAKEIYYREYWVPNVTGKEQFWAEDIVLFDTAIHLGPAQAKVLREVLTKRESMDALKLILFYRIPYYAAKGDSKYLRGFINRVTNLSKFIYSVMPEKDSKFTFVCGGLK